MEGYYSEPVEIGILQGKFVQPVRANKPVATDDIGGFVALVFERPRDSMGLELEITGSELTSIDAAEVFSRVLGKPVVLIEMPIPPDEEYFLRCSPGSMTPAFKPASASCADDIPKFGFRRWRRAL